MSNYLYEYLDPVTHAEAEHNLGSNNSDVIARTLISMGLHDGDWRWVQQHALRFLSHGDEMVVSAAILSLAHTARVNRSIDKGVVIPALESVASNPVYAGKVQDAIDDIDSI